MTSHSWKPRLLQAVETQDRGALAAVPKTDLHCHALLSAPLHAYESLSGRALTPPPTVFGSFQSFGEYIVTHLLPALTGAAAVRSLIRAAFDRLAAEGVVYTEMSFDLLIPEFIGLSDEAFGDLVTEECGRVADRLTVAPEIGIARSVPADEAAVRLRRWLATGVFKSIDLYDDETLGTVAEFAPLYRLASEYGLKLKAHAGELCGPERVRESVEILGLHAVQHGVRAAEDPAVCALLAERGTLLHLCPTSNYSLGICGDFETHPARRLFDQGVRITVNSDDFSLFGAGVCEEILNLKRMGFAANEVVRIVENGLGEIPEDTARHHGLR